MEKRHDHLEDVEHIEDDSEHESAEEIEEAIEISNTSLDLSASDVLDNNPRLRGSYVIQEDTASAALRSARPVIRDTWKTEEDTIVLSFSKSKFL